MSRVKSLDILVRMSRIELGNGCYLEITEHLLPLIGGMSHWIEGVHVIPDGRQPKRLPFTGEITEISPKKAEEMAKLFSPLPKDGETDLCDNLEIKLIHLEGYEQDKHRVFTRRVYKDKDGWRREWLVETDHWLNGAYTLNGAVLYFSELCNGNLRLNEQDSWRDAADYKRALSLAKREGNPFIPLETRYVFSG